jgi:hypothetical protein
MGSEPPSLRMACKRGQDHADTIDVTGSDLVGVVCLFPLGTGPATGDAAPERGGKNRYEAAVGQADADCQAAVR